MLIRLVSLGGVSLLRRRGFVGRLSVGFGGARTLLRRFSRLGDLASGLGLGLGGASSSVLRSTLLHQFPDPRNALPDCAGSGAVFGIGGYVIVSRMIENVDQCSKAWSRLKE